MACLLLHVALHLARHHIHHWILLVHLLLLIRLVHLLLALILRLTTHHHLLLDVLALDLACHSAHHWVLLLKLLQDLGLLLCNNEEHVSVVWVVHLVKNHLEAVFTQAVGLNKVLDSEHVQAHFLSFLKEPLFDLNEVPRDHAGLNRLFHR